MARHGTRGAVTTIAQRMRLTSLWRVCSGGSGRRIGRAAKCPTWRKGSTAMANPATANHSAASSSSSLSRRGRQKNLPRRELAGRITAANSCGSPARGTNRAYRKLLLSTTHLLGEPHKMRKSQDRVLGCPYCRGLDRQGRRCREGRARRTPIGAGPMGGNCAARDSTG